MDLKWACAVLHEGALGCRQPHPINSHTSAHQVSCSSQPRTSSSLPSHHDHHRKVPLLNLDQLVVRCDQTGEDSLVFAYQNSPIKRDPVSRAREHIQFVQSEILVNEELEQENLEELQQLERNQKLQSLHDRENREIQLALGPLKERHVLELEQLEAEEEQTIRQALAQGLQLVRKQFDQKFTKQAASGKNEVPNSRDLERKKREKMEQIKRKIMKEDKSEIERLRQELEEKEEEVVGKERERLKALHKVQWEDEVGPGGRLAKQQLSEREVLKKEMREAFEKAWWEEVYECGFNSMVLVLKRRHRNNPGGEQKAWMAFEKRKEAEFKKELTKLDQKHAKERKRAEDSLKLRQETEMTVMISQLAHRHDEQQSNRILATVNHQRKQLDMKAEKIMKTSDENTRSGLEQRQAKPSLEPQTWYQLNAEREAATRKEEKKIMKKITQEYKVKYNTLAKKQQQEIAAVTRQIHLKHTAISKLEYNRLVSLQQAQRNAAASTLQMKNERKMRGPELDLCMGMNEMMGQAVVAHQTESSIMTPHKHYTGWTEEDHDVYHSPRISDEMEANAVAHTRQVGRHSGGEWLLVRGSPQAAARQRIKGNRPHSAPIEHPGSRKVLPKGAEKDAWLVVGSTVKLIQPPLSWQAKVEEWNPEEETNKPQQKSPQQQKPPSYFFVY